MTIQLYGIPNCATVKKARAWLDEHHIAHEFINFKTQAPTREWLSWRKLTPEQQAQANSEAGAIALMMAQPSVIKRPVLVCGGKITVGFDADAYAALFQAAS